MDECREKRKQPVKHEKLTLGTAGVGTKIMFQVSKNLF